MFNPIEGFFDLFGTLARLDLRLLFLALMVLLLIASEAGYHIGRWATRRRPPNEGVKSSVGFITTGFLGLLAFLLGIALSIAAGRYEARRDSVLNEANDIGTAWLRAQMVAGEDGMAIQRLLRDYTAVRIEWVRDARSPEEQARVNTRSSALQQEIWRAAQRIAKAAPTPISGLLVASLNDTFDMAMVNQRNFTQHVPPYLLRLLLTVSILAVGAMGYNFGIVGNRQLIISTLLLMVWTAAIVLIVDIDAPRAGAVTIDPAPLIWTLQGFGPAPSTQ